MKPEPLDLNETKITKWVKSDLVVKEGDVDRAIKMTLSRIKQRIKSACEFYLRYKDNPELLIKEHPEYKEEIESFRLIPNPYFEECSTNEHLKEGDCRNCPDFVRENCFKGEMIENLAFKENYNEWLFKLTFKEVTL